MEQPTRMLPFLLTLHLSVSGVISTTFTLVNKCNYTIWPGIKSAGARPPLSTTGFVLQTAQSQTISAPKSWHGRFWARTLCTVNSTSGNFSCVTGDCGSGQVECDGGVATPPATLAEFDLNSYADLDFFDVSLVDGFNVAMLIVPVGTPGHNCSSAGCDLDLNGACPTELKLPRVGGNQTVGCKSACLAFNEPPYCCTGSYNTRDTCKPTSYSRGLKSACPNAYSYAFDHENIFTCGSADYTITFCPPALNTSQGWLGVSVGHSLTAGNGTARWLSPSGDFAFGFHQLSDELFLLAIWHDKIPNRTIIWYANGDNPAFRGSRLELNDSLGLVLRNPQGAELWRSNFASGTIHHGQINDAGNFVLLDQNSEALWDSFSHPTDTLVPNQILELNSTLSSKRGEFNFSLGRFKLHLQEDGNVVLNLINLPSKYNYYPYYSTETADAKNLSNSGRRVIFDKSGRFYILKRSGEMFYLNKPNETDSTDGFYYKATFNYDGVFTIAYHPKDPNAEQRWVIARTLPENICAYSTDRDGEGVCGFNSICTITTEQRPICKCPEGYSPLDSNDMFSGCIPNFQVTCQASGKQGSQEDLYTMKELPSTDWPGSAYVISSPSSQQDCKKSCLQDCLCVMVFFNGSCWKKKFPLSFGREDQALHGTSFMKLMNTNSSPLSVSQHQHHQHALIIVISILLGISVFIILMLVGAICFGFLYNRKKIDNICTNKSVVVDSNLQKFTFKELEEATSNFREELGRGSCGIVYRGTIDMTSVAVKKLDKMFQESDKEFKAEVDVIGQTHHKNLVRLLGYCNEEQHRILVYEFLSNGTLASFLFTHMKPNWDQRVHIALGIARGLAYLHEECRTQIIHCDIKPQNILLDDHYNARISDFGLAKTLLINQSHTETGIRGTKGYVAPDWFRSAPITSKVDTYSFGVLLLEIICCRKNVEKEFEDEEKWILTDWAYDCYKSKRLDILIENDYEAVSDMKRLERFVMIAIWCLQEDPTVRPTMKKVVLMLEGILQVTTPPCPFLCSSVSGS